MEATQGTVESDISAVQFTADSGIQRSGFIEAVARLILKHEEKVSRLEAQIEKLQSEKAA